MGYKGEQVKCSVCGLHGHNKRGHEKFARGDSKPFGRTPMHLRKTKFNRVKVGFW